jgi:tetratricopeptide (TPR) repeat protein
MAERPDSALAHYLYARVALSPDEALAEFERSTELDPEFGWGHVGAAQVLLAGGRAEEAVARYDRFFSVHGVEADDPTRQSYLETLVEAERWDRLDQALDGTSHAGNHRDEAADFELRGQILIARDVDDLAWNGWRDAVRASHGDDDWFLFLGIERARRQRHRSDAEQRLSQFVAHHKHDPSWLELTRAGIALADGDRDGAEELLQKEFSAKHPGTLGVHLALLLGISREWAGERELALAWYERAQEVATDWDDHELCRYLLKRVAERDLVAGDRHRSPDARALSLVARALRTDDKTERKRLLDRAARVGAWQLSETGYAVRGVFSRAAPVR